MKRTIIAAAFAAIALTPTAHADEPADCQEVYDMAHTIMEIRQKGISMVKPMEVAKDVPLYAAMVRQAYKRPQMSLQKNRDRYADNFANDWASECYEYNAGIK